MTTAWSWRQPAIIAVIALLLAMAGSAFWLQPWKPEIEPAPVDRMALALPDKPSIAVLPFTNMSDDASQEYFADGMSEDLITDLSKISGLFVIARNSSFTYKGKGVDVKQVARELGVRYVLEGSVRRAGEQVRINAQLVDATTGGHLWAERFDGSLADVFALQDFVTSKIIAALAVNLTAGEQAQRARQETDDPQAYDAFLKGWGHYRSASPEDFANAIPYLEDAIEWDPNYARAHATLAAVYWESWNNGWVRSLGLSFLSASRRAYQHLDEAMKEPTPLAHRVASLMLTNKGQYADALVEAERAVTLDPNDPDSNAAMASALVYAGRSVEGISFIKKAMRLDPYYPPGYLIILGRAQFAMERFEDAAATMVRAVDRSPENEWPLIYMAAAYGNLGREKEAELAVNALNKIRQEAGLGPLALESIDYLALGLGANREIMRAGLSRIFGTSSYPWSSLMTRGPSGYDVKGATKIDVATAKALHDRGVLFIDARRKSDWIDSHIPGAVHVGLYSFSEANIFDIVSKNQELVIYCHDRQCDMSARASARAVWWGYEKVYYLADGFKAWEAAGYTVEAP